MRTLITFLFLQIMVLFAAGQRVAGKISGSVKDASGKPMEAVTVALSQKADTTTTKAAITDKSGLFRFENIASGTYILSVTHVGYTAWYSQPLTITTAKPSLS